MADDERDGRLLQPSDVHWLGLFLLGALVLGLLGHPVLEVLWDLAVLAAMIVWFAHVRRGVLPMWPVIVVLPVAILLPGIVFGWGEDPAEVGDLLPIIGPMLLITAAVAGVEVHIRRVSRRERDLEVGVIGAEEAEEAARRELPWLGLAGAATVVALTVLLASSVLDGSWPTVLLFGLCPVVMPDLWRRVRGPRPGTA